MHVHLAVCVFFSQLFYLGFQRLVHQEHAAIDHFEYGLCLVCRRTPN